MHMIFMDISISHGGCLCVEMEGPGCGLGPEAQPSGARLQQPEGHLCLALGGDGRLQRSACNRL